MYTVQEQEDFFWVCTVFFSLKMYGIVRYFCGCLRYGVLDLCKTSVATHRTVLTSLEKVVNTVADDFGTERFKVSM